MGFVDILSQLRESAAGIDGADMSPYDDLSNEYTAMESGAQAKIGELEKALIALQKENSMIKAHNYDLMMTSSAAEEAPPTEEGVSDDDDDEFEGDINALVESESKKDE